MVSVKEKLKINKIRNKKEKVKQNIKNKEEKKKKTNKHKFWYYLLSFITLIAIIMVFCVIGFIIYIVKNAPTFNEEDLYNKASSVIYASDNSVIATLGMSVGNDEVETRTILTYEELPEVLIDAVVATEDSRFFQHNGVDLARFIKASIGQVFGQDGAGGASTLTMQVSKNALTDTTSEGIKGIIRKFTDVYLSVFQIEKRYSKEEILVMYLNSGYLGENQFGVEQASKVYFGKSAKDLTLSEAALIAGLFQAPTAYDPFINPEKAQARRNQVLNLMFRHGYITEEQCEIAKSMDIKTMLTSNTKSTNPYQGFINTVIDEVESKYKVSPYTVPMNIYTTLDKGKQEVINNIYDTYEFADEFIELGVAVVDNKTGALIAIGAGRNKSGGERNLNYATSISRHPGSTIKPILDYGPAFEFNNWSTYTPLFDDKTIHYTGSTSQMNNFDNRYEGIITAKYALSESKNTCALQAFQSTTNEQKWNFATSLGVTPCDGGVCEGNIINEATSIGAFDGTNPVQLASAYSAFANGGYYTKGYTVSKIEFIDSGEVIENSYTRERVMKETTAYLITNILFNVTPYSARVPGNQVASKTGTSSYPNDFLSEHGLSYSTVRDSWVATYNPDYTIAFWYAYPEYIEGHTLTMATANPQRTDIQAILAKNILTTGSTFTRPSGIKEVEVELETFPAMLPSEHTPSNFRETHLFVSGTEPTQVSTRYQTLDDVTELTLTKQNNTVTRVSWLGIETPDARDIDYLTNYYKKYTKDNWQEYLSQRIGYDHDIDGELGYDVYVRNGENLIYLGTTTNTYYDIEDLGLYDSVVVKTAYSIFKDNQSLGAEISVSGNTNQNVNKIELLPLKTLLGNEVNPTYSIGEEIPDFGIDTIKFYEKGKDITDRLTRKDITYVINECSNSCKTVDKIDNTKKGVYEITYTVMYLTLPYKETRTITIK